MTSRTIYSIIMYAFTEKKFNTIGLGPSTNTTQALSSPTAAEVPAPVSLAVTSVASPQSPPAPATNNAPLTGSWN